MCVIAFIPKGSKISRQTLRECWTNNVDGTGYMFIKNNRLILKKGFFKFGDFLKSFKKDFTTESPFILHFRVATKGTISIKNCHPFYVNSKLGFAHNGTIKTTRTGTAKSDTNQFNSDILSSLPQNFNKNEALLSLIEFYVGNDRLIFMDNKGNVTMINAALWYDRPGIKGDIYFSNVRHEPDDSNITIVDSILNELESPPKFCVYCKEPIPYVEDVEEKLCKECRDWINANHASLDHHEGSY